MKTIQSIVIEMREQFKATGLDTPELDARLLVQDILGISHEELLLNYSRIISDSESKTLIEAVQRRILREPVSRILGTRAFWKFDFKISRETLDPRADSEALVEAVLRHVDKRAPLTILDLGTGTGCLLLSLLHELPLATGLGVDISAGAVQIARQNAADLGLSKRADFTISDWSNLAINEPFDLVISNPPYIRDGDIADLEPEVRQYDPYCALAGGGDGLDCYRSIVNILENILVPHGKFFLEIGYDQAESVKGILAGKGLHVLHVDQDLAGRDRCIVSQRG